MDIVIHAGFEKTGNTALKAFLEYNSINLLKHGIYLIMPAHNLGRITGQIIQKLKNIPSDTECILISCEAFSYMSAEDLKLIMSHFPNRCEVKIFLYIRNYSKWIISNFLQALEGFYLKLDKKDVCVEDALITYITSQALKFHESYENIASVFNSNNITIKLYDRKLLIDGDICKDFINTLNFSHAVQFIPINKNLSIPAALAPLAYYFYRIYNISPPEIKSFVKNDIFSDILINEIVKKIYSNSFDPNDIDKLTLYLLSHPSIKYMLNVQEFNFYMKKILKENELIKRGSSNIKDQYAINEDIKKIISTIFHDDAYKISKKLSLRDRQFFLEEFSSNNNPLISMIIISFNSDLDLFKRCIESCINQTLSNIEIVVVDDCSSNGLELIVSSYQKDDARIKYVRNFKNVGMLQSRKNGYKASNGRYLWHVDSDDYIDVNACKLLYKNLEANNFPDMVFFGAYLVENNSVTSYKWTEIQLKKKQIPDLNWVLFKNHTAWSRILKREIYYKAVKYLDHDLYINNGEDYLAFTLAKYYTKTLVTLNKNLYYYVQYDNSYTSRVSPESIKNHFNEKTISFQTIYNIFANEFLVDIDFNDFFLFYKKIIFSWANRLIFNNHMLSTEGKNQLIHLFYTNIDIPMVLKGALAEKKAKQIHSVKNNFMKLKNKLAKLKNYLYRPKRLILRKNRPE